jgi:hypothetical protein
MRTTPHYVLVFALVYSFIPSVCATPEFHHERTSLQSEPRVLGPVTQLNIVNKVIAPDGFPRSLSCLSLVYHFVLTFIRTVLAEGTFPGPLIVAEKVNSFSNAVNCFLSYFFRVTTSKSTCSTTFMTPQWIRLRVLFVHPKYTSAFGSETPTALAWYLPETI